jgi:acyl-CoA synthetase (AMP-forming)/AMP-acid ligase II
LTKFKRNVDGWPEQLTWIITDDQKQPKVAPTDDWNECVDSDLAFLQYTSGSTSEPKGVMITHGNLAHNLTIITNELKAVEDTVVVSWLPQYHDMGLIGSYLGVIYCGGSGYYLSPLSFLQRPCLWIEAVSKYQATHLQAPNFAFKLISRKFNPNDYQRDTLKLSSVRHIINAAEPVDEDSISSFYEKFEAFGLQRVIYPTYGLAEHTVFVCSGGKQLLIVQKNELEVQGNVVLCDSKDTDGSSTSTLVGCGYPSRQGVDVRIVDRESCHQLPDDKVGEIWIHSPSKAAGYFMKETETKKEFHAKLDDGSGTEYLRSGDLGFIHENELFICGRLKDLIIGKFYFLMFYYLLHLICDGV